MDEGECRRQPATTGIYMCVCVNLFSCLRVREEQVRDREVKTVLQLKLCSGFGQALSC